MPDVRKKLAADGYVVLREFFDVEAVKGARRGAGRLVESVIETLGTKGIAVPPKQTVSERVNEVLRADPEAYPLAFGAELKGPGFFDLFFDRLY